MNDYNKTDLNKVGTLLNGFDVESTGDQEDNINENNGDNDMEVNNKVRELGYEFNSKNKFVCNNMLLVPFINLINDLEKEFGKIDFTKYVGIDRTTLNSFINEFKLLATDRRTYTRLIYNQLMSYAFIANDSKHLNVNEDSIWRDLNSSTYYTSDISYNEIVSSIYLISNFFTTKDILNKEAEIKEPKDNLLIINLCLTSYYSVESFTNEEKKLILVNFELFKNSLKDINTDKHISIIILTDLNFDKYVPLFKNYNILKDEETTVICRNYLSSFKTWLNKGKTKEFNGIDIDTESLYTRLADTKIAKYIHLRNEIVYLYNNSDKFSYNTLRLILEYIENHAECKDHEYLLLDIINDLNLNENFKEYYVYKTEKRKEENMLNNKPKTIKVSKLSKVINDTNKSFKIENFDIEEMKPIVNILNLNFIVTHIHGVCKYFAYNPYNRTIIDLYEIRINEKYENNTPVVEEILFTNLSYSTFKYNELTNTIHLNNEMFIGSKVTFLNLHQLIITLRIIPKGGIHYRNNQQVYMQQYNPYHQAAIHNNEWQLCNGAQVYNPYKQYAQPSFGYNQQPFIRETNNELIREINDRNSYLIKELADLEDERKSIMDDLKTSFNNIMDALPKL